MSGPNNVILLLVLQYQNKIKGLESIIAQHTAQINLAKTLAIFNGLHLENNNK